MVIKNLGIVFADCAEHRFSGRLPSLHNSGGTAIYEAILGAGDVRLQRVGITADIAALTDGDVTAYAVWGFIWDITRQRVRVTRNDVVVSDGAVAAPPITTNPDTSQTCPDDRVNRAFVAQRPNQLWVSDFTYVSSWQGTVYVAFVIDVFARKIVGLSRLCCANRSRLRDGGCSHQ